MFQTTFPKLYSFWNSLSWYNSKTAVKTGMLCFPLAAAMRSVPPPPPEEQLPREVYGSSDRYATGQVLCEVLTNFMDNGAMLRSSRHRQERRPWLRRRDVPCDHCAQPASLQETLPGRVRGRGMHLDHLLRGLSRPPWGAVPCPRQPNLSQPPKWLPSPLTDPRMHLARARMQRNSTTVKVYQSLF